MGRLRVLVADDEAIYLTVLTARLTDEGYEVIPVHDREELEAAASRADALVVDGRLPSEKLEGLEAVASLVESREISPDKPIIFISVYAEADDPIREKLRQLPVLTGRYQWLQKPFETELLVGLLQETSARPMEGDS